MFSNLKKLLEMMYVMNMLLLSEAFDVNKSCFLSFIQLDVKFEEKIKFYFYQMVQTKNRWKK